MAVSRDSSLFSSWDNTALIRQRPGGGDGGIDGQRLILLNIDPPQHTKLRGIVSRGFEALTARAERIVTEALAGGTGDFVTDVACELPLQAIAELLGIPQEDRRKIFDWSNQMVGADDPDYAGDAMSAAAGLLTYSMALAQDRRDCPRDDIVTRLVHAQVDGGDLSADEFGFFVLLLAVAGNETTRNAISHGMAALLDHPAQWELYRAQRPDTAADEIVRWSTPVTVFQRTARADTVLGGQQVKAGQRLGLFYRSANFDEDVFDQPGQFDISRSPNPHLGFGGNGAHFCLGANLARLEIELIFNAIADGMPSIKRAGQAERLRSGWLNGIKRLPVTYR
jgi:cholest-4-en-3-one 26-monooxygenase